MMQAYLGFYGPEMLILIPGIILALWAQIKLSSTYARYSKVGTERGLTGAEAARAILDRNGLANIELYTVPGHLTDHYDPMKRTVYLSEGTYHGNSIAAVGVAAHEVGHAIQHQQAYGPLGLRMALVPITGIATNLSVFLILGGLLLSTPFAAKLIWGGVILYSVIAFFQLVTLPVEYDASRRAKEQLLRLGLVSNVEQSHVSKVLSAAALTYVAAMINALLNLLRLVMIARSRDRD